MGRWKFVRALCAGTLGFGLALNAAGAADLQLKAPPAPPMTPGLDVHGFFDLTFSNDYITPRGLLVTNTGLTTQALMGLVFDIYKNPGGFINDVSVVFGTWNDLWSKQGDAGVGAWNEFDWFVDADIKFAQYWKFEAEYGEFLPPAHGTTPSSFPADERHVQLTLSYDDSRSGFPITFNPYIRWFYETSGPSVVVLGSGANTYYFEPGIVPTVDLKKYWGVPVTLLAPTWFSVAPSNFWNSGVATNFCGKVPAPFTSGPPSSACATSNLGLVSTGLTAKAPLDFIIPTRLGNWYIKGGFQYYHIFNDALVAAQEFTGTAGSVAGVPSGYAFGNYASAHRDVVAGFIGTGVTF
jgi:hypothetical protein